MILINFQSKMFVLVLISWCFMLTSAIALSNERVIEISSRSGSMFLSLQFFNKDELLKTKPILRERFYWTKIPSKATHFTLKTLGRREEIESAKKKLLEKQNTYVRVKKIPKNEQTQFKIEIEERNRHIGNARTEAWVYLGSLIKYNDTSKWRSVYIVNENLTKIDEEKSYTYNSFKQEINDSNGGKVYLTDFPLYLRKAPRTKNTTDSLLRAGQKIKILKVKRIENSRSIWAKVIVPKAKPALAPVPSPLQTPSEPQ